jgi:hypothetical protein
MPAAHWSIVTLAAAAAAGLFRRRAAAVDGTEGAAARPTIDELLSTPATPSIVYSYAFSGCTDREIADRFRMGESDVRATFSVELTVSRAARAYALRRAQTELATGKANGPMLTWLGRNDLGQALNPAARGEPEPEVE